MSKQHHCERCEASWHLRWLLVWATVGLGLLGFIVSRPLDVWKHQGRTAPALLLGASVVLVLAVLPHLRYALKQSRRFKDDPPTK